MLLVDFKIASDGVEKKTVECRKRVSIPVFDLAKATLQEVQMLIKVNELNSKSFQVKKVVK